MAAAREEESEIELPRRRTGRGVKVALVLLVDAVLVGSGGWMIREHFARGETRVVAEVVVDAGTEVAVREPPAPPTPSTAGSNTSPSPSPSPSTSPTTTTVAPTSTSTSTSTPTKPVPVPVPVKVPPKPVVVPRLIDAGVVLPGPADAGAVPPLEPDAAAEEPDAAVVELPQVIDAAEEKPPAPPGPDPAWVESMTRGIRDVVEAHRDVIEDCYRRAAKDWTREEPLAGRIDVHLTIVPSGDVEDVRVVENQTGSDALGSCLVTVMGTWRYPAPGDDAMEFIWPFNFRGQGGGAPREP